MVLSMAVLLIPIIAIVWFFQTVPDENIEAVDISPALQRAEQQSPYAVLRPVNLPEQWVPVRVAWAADGERWIDGEPAAGNSWQLGYLSPDEIYVGLQQRDQAAAAFLNQVTREGRPQGDSFTVAGRIWEHWTSMDGRTQSLVWQDDQLVTAVSGDTELEELLAFVSTLSDGS